MARLTTGDRTLCPAYLTLGERMSDEKTDEKVKEEKAEEKEKKDEKSKEEETKTKEEGAKLFYPNKWARIVLTSAEEVMGEKGIAALLNMGGMSDLIGNYPPDNMKKEFDFNRFGKLQQGIWDMYGNRGARVFATRAGEQSFNDGVAQFKSVAQAAQVAMKVGSLEAKVKIALEFFQKLFASVTDQKVVVGEDEKHWTWTIEVCPMCWGRKSDDPVCHLAVGVLQAGMSWMSGGKKFRIMETECKAKGDKDCIIKIEKIPVE